jgi:hypothetical protein
MKKILILAAMLAALTACEKTVRKTFHLTGAPDLSLSYEGGYALFGIEANEDDRWTLTADADWFTVQQSFGNGDAKNGYDDAVFLVWAERWIMNSTRSGHITVTGPNGSFTKNITQSPKQVPAEPLQLTGELPCAGGELTVELPEGYWVNAETDSDWLTIVACEEGKLVVSAGLNPLDDETRTAVVHIYLSDGAPLANVTVTQVATPVV